MIEIFKLMLWDKTAFLGYARATAMFAGLVMASGKIELPPRWEWVGIALAAAAMVPRSSSSKAQVAQTETVKALAVGEAPPPDAVVAMGPPKV